MEEKGAPKSRGMGQDHRRMERLRDIWRDQNIFQKDDGRQSYTKWGKKLVGKP